MVTQLQRLCMLYTRGGKTSLTEESLAENQKQQQAAKSAWSVKYSSLTQASFT